MVMQSLWGGPRETAMRWIVSETGSIKGRVGTDIVLLDTPSASPPPRRSQEKGRMKKVRSEAGFTVLELVFAIVIIAVLSGIYFSFMDSYRTARVGEQAAKVLMLAARVQEDFFAKQHHYFDAEVSGNGGDAYLVTPDGAKTDVAVPPNVVLSLKTRGKEQAAFSGYAFFSGSKVLHKYDSETGKMTTVPRSQDDSG
jgi:prepilin-type N-terminal cleavage/methylation domain-containing protein